MTSAADALEAFADPMLRILLACAAVSLTLGTVGGDLIDGVAIMAAVLVVTAVGTYNQVRAERDFSALDMVSRRERVRVVRAGRVVEVDAEELVNGDVIEVDTGAWCGRPLVQEPAGERGARHR